MSLFSLPPPPRADTELDGHSWQDWFFKLWKGIDTSTGGGGSTTVTTVEVDLGSKPVPNGTFNISGTFTVGKPIIITQAPGPYTGKGTLTDEIEMDQVNVTGYVLDASTIKCNWGSNTRLCGNVKFNYLVGA